GATWPRVGRRSRYRSALWESRRSRPWGSERSVAPPVRSLRPAHIRTRSALWASSWLPAYRFTGGVRGVPWPRSRASACARAVLVSIRTMCSAWPWWTRQVVTAAPTAPAPTTAIFIVSPLCVLWGWVYPRWGGGTLCGPGLEELLFRPSEMFFRVLVWGGFQRSVVPLG